MNISLPSLGPVKSFACITELVKSITFNLVPLQAPCAGFKFLKIIMTAFVFKYNLCGGNDDGSNLLKCSSPCLYLASGTF